MPFAHCSASREDWPPLRHRDPGARESTVRCDSLGCVFYNSLVASDEMIVQPPRTVSRFDGAQTAPGHEAIGGAICLVHRAGESEAGRPWVSPQKKTQYHAPFALPGERGVFFDGARGGGTRGEGSRQDDAPQVWSESG